MRYFPASHVTFFAEYHCHIHCKERNIIRLPIPQSNKPTYWHWTNMLVVKPMFYTGLPFDLSLNYDFLKWGYPKQIWCIMENPISNGWSGGTPILGNHQMVVCHRKLFDDLQLRWFKSLMARSSERSSGPAGQTYLDELGYHWDILGKHEMIWNTMERWGFFCHQ